jgi:ABC-2 type transport system permease protein
MSTPTTTPPAEPELAGPSLPISLEGLGRPIKGPSAFGSDWRRFLQLTWALAITDFKLKFFGSVLGYFWQLMRPLMLFGILYFVFDVAFDVGDGVRFYPVSLLLGIVLYGFFTEATTGSVRSISMRENLVRKIEFPRLAVPMATVLTALFNVTLNLLTVGVFLVLSGGRPEWSWLLLPPIVAVLAIWASGIAMILSSFFVRYRDVEPIWDVVMQALFYAAPIIYTIDMVREKAGEDAVRAIAINPFTAVLLQARHDFLDHGAYPSAANALDSTALVLVPLAIVVATVALGLWVFVRQAPHIAEDL